MQVATHQQSTCLSQAVAVVETTTLEVEVQVALFQEVCSFKHRDTLYLLEQEELVVHQIQLLRVLMVETLLLLA
jgi:hypothetical protein